MNNQEKHTDQHSEFFSNVQISYSKSKDDVWKEMMENGRDEKEVTKTRKLGFVYYSVAATMLLLIGLSLFFRFYSRDIYCPKGRHMVINLPDGSKVNMNANTTLKYYPYWWRFSRNVKLNGEAYFEVESGNKFRVVSAHGTTSVMGTSFNIFARENAYEVYCVTGKVKVEASVGEEKILQPNQMVVLDVQMGTLLKKKIENVNHAFAWTKNEFVFTSSPLKEVYQEMERQFNIEIEIEEDISGIYTGNFRRGSSPMRTLETISKPFGLNVVKISNKKYIIKKNTY